MVAQLLMKSVLVHMNPPLVSVLSQTNPYHILPSHLFPPIYVEVFIVTLSLVLSS
jgi:hypothetical protein